ncbi:MAG: hypothetical protein FWE40_04445 [Oscillospiraceae bacterium]|nr:hypothetical protein [Oscillospiraceae bacterium]
MKKLFVLMLALALLGACAAPAVVETTTTQATLPPNEPIELTLTMQNTRDDVDADFIFDFGEHERFPNLDGWIVRTTAPIYNVRLFQLEITFGGLEYDYIYRPIEDFPTIATLIPNQTLLLENYITVGLGSSMAFGFEDANGNARMFEFHLYMWGAAGEIDGEPVAPYYTLREIAHYSRAPWTE